MPITITEQVGSRSWSGGSVTFHYTLAGSSDDIAIKAALLENTATTYNNLRREDNPSIEPIWVNEATGDGQWDCQIRYTPYTSGLPQPGESSFRFDTGGGTALMRQSLETIQTYGLGTAAPDYKGAINVSKDSVEGVEIVSPIYEWAETHTFRDAQVTQDYRNDLFDLTGTVNDGTFKGLQAGECLFRGASGAKRNDEDWEIAFRFAGSPNRTGLSVGAITGIDKKGWDYLWVLYEETEDATAKRLVKQPRAVYIEQVYYLTDFSKLRIGT